MDPQSLSYRFLNEIMDHHVHIGVPEEIGSNVPNLIKDVPNLMKDIPNVLNDVPNVLKDVPRVPKCISRWESTPNHFLMGF